MQHMTDITLNRVKTYRQKDARPADRRLFGHLINPEYVASARRRWRHDDFDSDVEEMIVLQVDSDDDDGDSHEYGDDSGSRRSRERSWWTQSDQARAPFSIATSTRTPIFHPVHSGLHAHTHPVYRCVL